MKHEAIGSSTEKVQSWNPVRDAPNDEISYIDLGAIDNDLKSIDAAQRLAGRDAPSRARQLVCAGDILVSTVRPYLNGVALVPSELDGATASTGFCVVRPAREKVHGAYLFHWLKTPDFIADMVRKSTGASYPAVSDRIIQQSLMPLPPLPEQRRIAAILDKADMLRCLRRQSLARLAALGQSIFHDMFGDPIANSKGWDERHVLGDVADIASGITKGRKLNGMAVREVPYLAVSNVQEGHVKLDVVKTIEATDAEISRYRLLTDDILLTEGGDPDKLGRGGIWHGGIAECIHQNHVFRVRITSSQVDALFLSLLIGSQRGKRYFMRSAKQTTGIASINMTQLRQFPLLLPPHSIQLSFRRMMREIDEKLQTVERASREADALFAAFQHRAFRGEL